MTQAYDAIIATITTASDATSVTKSMVKSTQWREGTSGTWLSTDCTLTAGKVYQFRTPLSGMSSGTTAILPNIKASVTVAWDTTATPITSVGASFMHYYARNCSSLTSLSVPDTSGLTSVGDNFMRYYAANCSSLTSLSVPDTSGLTTVGNYFMSSYARNCSSLTSLSVPDTSGLTTVGNYFMAYYADGCTSLTSFMLPSATGWFASNNVSWSVPSTRLGSLKGYAPNSTAQTAWQALTVSGKTLYTNYIQSEDDVEVTATGQNLTLTCAAGSYSLTGTNADLTVKRNYVFALGVGSYILVGTSVGLFILSPTPACRTATIEYENRTFAIPHENRTATIEYENRTLEVKCH